MLYSILLGGLGNQLFIVSNLYSLSIDRKIEYYVTNFTNSCTRRTEESFWLETILKSVKKVNKRPSEIKVKYSERGMNFQKIPQTTKGLELYGYWQSPKYFEHNKKKVIELFTEYKKEISNKLNKYYKFKKPTISIHIRRADYLKLQHAHVVQTEEYYKKSLERLATELNYKNINELNKEYTFVIFSDDIKWCETESELFKSLKDKYFMKTECALYDLYLMSMCNHNIIGNSTFSWWGSFLNENKDKKVVAPSKWFNISYMAEEKWQDIYTEDMIII